MARLAIVINKELTVTDSNATLNQLAEITEWIATNPNATTEDVKHQLLLMNLNYTADEEVGIIGWRPCTIRH